MRVVRGAIFATRWRWASTASTGAACPERRAGAALRATAAEMVVVAAVLLVLFAMSSLKVARGRYPPDPPARCRAS